MNEPLAVGIRNRLRKRKKLSHPPDNIVSSKEITDTVTDLPRVSQAESAPQPGQLVLQGAARHILHNVVEPSLVRTRLVNVYDVGMTQSCGKGRFLQETLRLRRRGEKERVQYLDGDLAVETQLIGQIHRTEPARPQALQEP
jgi:hypothetical protein